MNSSSGNQTAAASPLCTDPVCVFMATAETITFILGISGNGLVIWITGFKMKKSVNTILYLSLAVSDFLFCATLPLYIISTVKGQWLWGSFLCKFRSFLLSLNMFSSIFLLVIISVDRCVVILFPVWAQTKRSIRKASVTVLLAWIISAALSTLFATARYIKYSKKTKKTYCSLYFTQKQVALVVSRFIFGFVIPFLIITVCSVLITRKLKRNQRMKSTKPFRVMAALVAVFFICWLPYHILSLIKYIMKFRKPSSPVYIALNLSSTLVYANSFLNPFLYTFMGKDVKTTFFSVLSKIQSAMEEGGLPFSQVTSVSSGTQVACPDSSECYQSNLPLPLDPEHKYTPPGNGRPTDCV